jgi:hypothetical protein
MLLVNALEAQHCSSQFEGSQSMSIEPVSQGLSKQPYHPYRTLHVGMFVIALLAMSCPSPETPIHPPGTATTHAGLHRDAPPAPPLAPPVWLASVFTSGGFPGFGKGSISVHRDGRANAKPACSVRLPEDLRLAVESAVAAAHPDGWRRSYQLATPSGMSDQYYYSLSLTVGEAEGSVITYAAGWQDDSFDMIPEDLRRLYEALWAARTGLEKTCP